jgi:hypothetical protein
MAWSDKRLMSEVVLANGFGVTALLPEQNEKG